MSTRNTSSYASSIGTISVFVLLLVIVFTFRSNNTNVVDSGNESVAANISASETVFANGNGTLAVGDPDPAAAVASGASSSMMMPPDAVGGSSRSPAPASAPLAAGGASASTSKDTASRAVGASRRAVASTGFEGDYDHLARYGEWDETDLPQAQEVG